MTGIFDWFTKYRVSCDWACHRARGSQGGEDRIHPAGSPILAPYDATVTYGLYDDGASFVQFKYTNGYAHQAVHPQLAGRVPHGSRVAAGTVCALSDGRLGSYGAGTSTGPHIHFQGHKPDGTRIPWQDVPAPTGNLAGITVRPLPTNETKEEDDMKDYLEVISIPVSGGRQYWSVNWANWTKALITKGTQLDYLKNRGFPRIEDQPEETLDGLTRIDAH